MTSQQCERDSLQVHFVPGEAAKLLEQIDRWLGEAAGEGPLVSAQEKLADAAALAAWLREDVRVELSIVETIDLLDTLTEMGHTPTASGHPGDDGCLDAVRSKLEAALGRTGTVPDRARTR